MAFATQEDLTTYAPDVFSHGVDDWTTELALAEQEVADQIQVKYYTKHHSRNTYDKTKLTESQWTKATVYKALAGYIMPKLATFRIDDVFVEQIKFYKERFAEEMDLQFALGIQYDTDNDGTVEDGEITEYTQNRLYR